MFSTVFRQLLPSVQRLTSPRTFSSSSLVSGAKVAVPSGLPEREQTIWDKLNDKFAPSQLQVEDVSGGCGTFYAIVIASDTFKGLSIVKQHRMVTDTLKQEIEGIHGLQIKTVSK